jgi:hypothetical protein
MKRFGSVLALAGVLLLKVYSQDVSEFEYLIVDVESYIFGTRTADVSQIAGALVSGYKGAKKDIIIPDTINGITVIGFNAYAFAGYGLEHVTFPETIESINYAAFKNNNLTSITIPKNVKYIRGEAFADNPLISITFLGETELYRDVPYVPSVSEEFDGFYNDYWYVLDFKGLPAKYARLPDRWVVEEIF